MPVVIREMHVKVNVEEEQRERPNFPESRNGRPDRDALIDACVEKVVEIIKREEKR
jgi:hypothetical protein